MGQTRSDESGIDQDVADVHIGQHTRISIWSPPGWDNTNLFAEHELFVIPLGFFSKRLAIFWRVHANIANDLPVTELNGVPVEYRSNLSSVTGSKVEEKEQSE